jgi:hypothetical protein
MIWKLAQSFQLYPYITLVIVLTHYLTHEPTNTSDRTADALCHMLSAYPRIRKQLALYSSIYNFQRLSMRILSLLIIFYIQS